MSKSDEGSLAEPLILSSLGTKGYLRFPKAFTEKFDFVAKSLPNPTPRLVKRGDTIQLIYEWSTDQLEQAAKDAARSRSEKRNSKA